MTPIPNLNPSDFPLRRIFEFVRSRRRLHARSSSIPSRSQACRRLPSFYRPHLRMPHASSESTNARLLYSASVPLASSYTPQVPRAFRIHCEFEDVTGPRAWLTVSPPSNSSSSVISCFRRFRFPLDVLFGLRIITIVGIFASCSRRSAPGPRSPADHQLHKLLHSVVASAHFLSLIRKSWSRIGVRPARFLQGVYQRAFPIRRLRPGAFESAPSYLNKHPSSDCRAIPKPLVIRHPPS